MGLRFERQRVFGVGSGQRMRKINPLANLQALHAVANRFTTPALSPPGVYGGGGGLTQRRCRRACIRGRKGRHAGRSNPHQHLPGARLWRGDLLEFHYLRCPELPNENRFHCNFLPRPQAGRRTNIEQKRTLVLLRFRVVRSHRVQFRPRRRWFWEHRHSCLCGFDVARSRVASRDGSKNALASLGFRVRLGSVGSEGAGDVGFRCGRGFRGRSGFDGSRCGFRQSWHGSGSCCRCSLRRACADVQPLAQNLRQQVDQAARRRALRIERRIVRAHLDRGQRRLARKHRQRFSNLLEA